MIQRPAKNTVRYTLTFDVPASDTKKDVTEWLLRLGALIHEVHKQRTGVVIHNVRATLIDDGSDKE